MSLLTALRSQYPHYADYTDDELISALNPAGPSDQPPPAAPEQINDSWQVTRGFKAGVDQTQALGGGLLAAAGDALGWDAARDTGMDIYQSNMEEARQNAAPVEFTDIEGVGDLTDWALYTAGNLVPTMATVLAGGGIGGAAARVGAKKYAQKVIAEQVAKGLGKREAAQVAARETAKRFAGREKIGQMAGAYATGSGIETGSIYGDTEDAGVSFAHGAVAGAIEALPAMNILNKFGLGKQAKEQIKRSVLKATGEQALLEGGTEGLQTLVEQHAAYWVENNGESLLANLGEVNTRDIINATAAGALGGSMFGAGGQALSNRQADITNARAKAARAEAAARGGDALDQEIAGAQAMVDGAPNLEDTGIPRQQRKRAPDLPTIEVTPDGTAIPGGMSESDRAGYDRAVFGEPREGQLIEGGGLMGQGRQNAQLPPGGEVIYQGGYTDRPGAFGPGADQSFPYPGQDAAPVATMPAVEVSATAPNIAGESIDQDWTRFTQDSGTLNIPRADMPQVKAENRGALVNYLNARGVEHEQIEVDPRELKPTQAEFSPAKVQKAREFTGGDRSILVSADGHVVDGHHQWMAKRDAGEPVKAIQLKAPIADLVPLVKAFPSSEQDSGASPAQPGQTQLIVKSDGSPYRTEASAKLAANGKRKRGEFTDYTVAQVEGGFAIAPAESTNGQEASQGMAPAQADVAVADQAPVKETAAPEQNAVKGIPIVEIPLDRLRLSPDVPQFKDGANDQGVVEPLQGRVDRRGMPPIQAWERLDGSLEIISGRHRVDLFNRDSNETTIPSQVHREADGFDQYQAAALDAELNIRDNQGTVKDYVQYFRSNPEITEEAANDRGVLSRSLGKRSWSIARQGSDETVAAHSAGILSDEGAERVSKTAPNDERLQAVGIRAIQQGKSISNATNMMQAVSAMAGGDAQSLDMFGFDDSAMKEAEAMAKLASKKQREIADLLRPQTAVIRAGTRASREGINDTLTPEQRRQRMTQLQQERDTWDNWSTNPELVGQLRDELNLNPLAAPEAADTQADNQADPLLTSYTEQDLSERDQALRAQQEAQDAEARRLEGKAQADAEAGSFSLAGSSAPADVAAAGGQSDLLGANTAPATAATRSENADSLTSPVSNVKKTEESLLEGEAKDAADWTQGPVVEYRTKKGKVLEGVIAPTQEDAKAIDAFTMKADGGWFVRKPRLDKFLDTQSNTDQESQPATAAADVDDTDVADTAERPVADEPRAEQVEARPDTYGKGNTLFTEDAAERARALLKAKLAQLNSGLDPEIMQAGLTLAGYHIEAGARSFAAYSRAMVADLGAGIKPYLRGFYEQVRYYPGFDAKGMSDAQAIESHQAQAQQAQSSDESLADALYRQIDTLSDNRQLKAALAEHQGITAREVDAEMLKEGQEALELALVRKARDLVAEGNRDPDTYQALVQLYNNQPNLNVRSSTSMQNQAYSTPAPIAFLASRLAGIDNNATVYEPTAGNGMLLIGASTEKTTANELNDQRAGQLRDQGFTVTQHDATDYVPADPVDAAIMNPPFGRLDAPVKYDGYTLKAIDHLITAKALEAIKDDGRGVIIIGAAKAAGGISPSDRTFFNWLYSHYNVVDHFEINGDLYKRQGAGWPIRVVVVNGRESSQNIAPVSGSIERLNEWSEVYERYQESLDAIERNPVGSGAPSVAGTVQPGPQDGPRTAADANAGQAGAADSGSRGQRGARGFNPGNTAGRGQSGPDAQRAESESREPAVGRQPKRTDGPGGVRPESQPAVGRDQTTAGADAAQPDGRSGERDRLSASDFQASYATRSSGFNDKVLTPVNMAGPTQDALTALERAVGNIDQYVMDKLGYGSLDALHDAFMGLQVDTIAAAIYNTEVKGKGIVIADQTGVGKGRQAAGIIRYALRQGKTPIFVTVKDNLFTDMYNDLKDIGEENIQPLILNQDGAIKDGARQLFKNPARGKHVANLTDITAEGALPAGKNALFMTYSQINTPNLQRQVLSALKGNAFFVLDESHNAAGEREIVKKIDGANVKQTTGAGFMYQLIDGAPVVYLSATFAKRPDNMPIYYRTDLLDAVDTAEELVTAVEAGGVPLQTVMSGMLAESGQLFRRERSFEGISIPTEVDTANGGRHAAVADTVTEGLRAVVAADWAFHNVFMEEYAAQVQLDGGDAFGAGNKASSSVDHNNFTSVVHNYVGQLLMALKADKVVADAIRLHREGKKPVVALSNTMGAFLSDYVDAMGIKPGEVVDADYRDVLRKALDRTRRVAVTLPNGEKEKRDIPLSALDPETAAAYQEADRVIEALDLGELPLSPIDYVRDKLEAAGIRMSEITGRGLRIDYSGPEPVLAKRSAQEKSDKRGTVDAFNGGELDGLVLNSAGSTGLSIHASERFSDQKPRHMLVMQADADINVLMQMLGRINRTGQVELPGYTMMGLDIPAEKRPLARTALKMKSLNANTSANTESDTSIDASDILNKYGDQVVNDFLTDDPDVGDMLGLNAVDGAPTPGTALKFTGRLALLPVDLQREIYEEIEVSYVALIDFLNKTGQNDLEARTIDLDARIIETKVAYEGKAPDTRFGGHTLLHKVNAKYQGKPPRPEEVKAAIEDGLDGRTPDQISDRLVEGKAEDPVFLGGLQKRLDKARAQLAELETNKADQKKLGEAGAEVIKAEEKLDTYHGQRNKTRRLLELYQVGRRFRLDLGDDTETAVVTSVKDTHKAGKGSPWSPSKTRVHFMVNSGIRTLELPLSKLDTEGAIYVETLREQGTEGLETIFKPDMGGGDKREVRYLGTGNLIAGSAQLEGGRIINFTDNQGDTHQGILMPKKFGKKGEFAGAGSSQKFPMRDKEVLTGFLKANKDELTRLQGVASANGLVRLMPLPSGEWQIRVPKANKDRVAKSVKFDGGLIKAMGREFFGSGNTMAARFPESRLRAVVDSLVGLTPLYGLPSQRDAWVEAGGQPVAEAEARFARGSTPRNKPPRPAPLTLQQAHAIATDLLGDWRGRPQVRVVQSESGLTPGLQAEIAAAKTHGEVRGVYFQGQVYLVADNLRSRAQLEEVILHEAIGHYGVAQVFGKDYRQELNKLYLKLGGDKGIKRLAERHGINLDAYFADGKRMTQPERQAMLADELVAHLAGLNIEPKIIDKIVATLKNWLRDHGFDSLLKYGRTEILELIAASKEAVIEGKPTHNGQLRKKGDRPRFMVGQNANENALPMDEASRMERARAMGFRVDEIFYHGTNIEDIAEFDLSKFGTGAFQNIIEAYGEAAVYATTSRQHAESYGDEIIPFISRGDYAYINAAEELRDWHRETWPETPFDEWLEDVGVYDALDADAFFADSLSDALKSGKDGVVVDFEDLPLGARGDFAKGDLAGKVLITNRPEKLRQIDAAFDPERSDENGLRFSRADALDDGATGDTQPFAAPTEGRFDKLIRVVQDKMNPLKQTQKAIKDAGGRVTEDNNAYLAEEAFYGKTEKDLDDIRTDLIEPMVAKMAEHDIHQEELDVYLIARHARERNAQIAKINPAMPDGGSGMTNAEADQVLAQARREGKAAKLDEIAEHVYAMTGRQREILRESGLQTDELTDTWEATYAHYVPLKGWAADEKDPSFPSTGKGFSIRGKESLRAMGRTTRAASPSSTVVNDLTEKVIRHRKNEVGQALLKLVRDNPNPDYWEVYSADDTHKDRGIVKIRDANGDLVEQVRYQAKPMAMLSDRYFTTKVNGQTYYLDLKDDRLMRAMKNMGPEPQGAVLRTLGSINRLLSSLVTSYNPEFTVSNFSRDIQTAVLNVLAETDLHDGRAAGVRTRDLVKGVVKDVPKAMRAIHRSLRGKAPTNEEWADAFEQFQRDGAKTGYFDMKDVDEQSRDLERMIAMAQGGAKGGALKFAKAAKDFVEHANTAVENAVRLSLYKNAIEAGVSRKQAASLAKNATVNFNRKGEIGTALNALYMFANASIQGTAQFARVMGTLKVDPVTGKRSLNKAQKVASGLVVASVGLAALNRGMAGEDDDGENWYDKVPGHERERNLILMKALFGGPQDGSYWKIPLPYGYNIFHVMGDNIEAVATGNKDVGRATVDLGMALAGSFSPIGLEDSEDLSKLAAKSLAPTIAKPFVQLAVNENFYGSPIYRENYQFGPQRPDSMLTKKSTKDHWKAVSAWVNEATGGTANQPGAIDVSPDTLGHLFDFATGGAGAFVDRSTDLAVKLAKGEDVDSREVPFRRRLDNQVRSYDDINRFYTRATQLAQIAQDVKEANGPERSQLARKYRDETRLHLMAKGVEKRLRALRKQQRAVESRKAPEAFKEKRLESIKKRMNAEVDRFNKRYAELL